MFYALNIYVEDNSSRDLLWHRKKIWNHFITNYSNIEVQKYLICIDEMSKGVLQERLQKEYPFKTKKFWIKVQSCLNIKYVYIKSVYNKRSGNKMEV